MMQPDPTASDLSARSADAVLEALDPEQREVARHPLGPMCVLAGAGTGKTRAITHRIAYGVHAGMLDPRRVLAVTFTARAAGEMRARLRDLGVPGVQARTFHAAALRQLHYFWPAAIGGAAPEVLPSKAALVAEATSRLRLDVDRVAVRELAAEVEWAKVGMLTAQSYPAAARRAGREPAGLDPTAMARVLEGYEQCKAERGVIDFEDVLLLTVGILGERDDIARAVREQYRHVVVDEYQDVNAVQQRLLELWLGDRQDICVVGDPNQTIYSFTGASPQHLLDFPRRYPAARTVRLVRNYRSTPQVVRLANLVAGHGTAARSGAGRATGLSSRAAGTDHRESSAGPLVAQREDGPEPAVTAYPDDTAEAAGVAAAIADLLRAGQPPAEVAVLLRTNAQSEAIEAALSEAGVPYLVRGGERFFARQEVRAALVLLRGAVRSDDATVPLPDLVRDVLGGAGWSPEPPSGSGPIRERWESLSALATLSDEIVTAQPQARMRDFVAHLEERAASQHAPTVSGVTIASLHAAKGLEWDVVFLVGCSEGFIPIALAQGPAAIEEERRLFYVGVTRARRQLRLSWAAARSAGGRAHRRPTRFLDPAAAVLGMDAAPHGDRPRRRRSPASSAPARCRGCGALLTAAAERKTGRCGSCPPGYDEGLYEALRTWRREVAQRRSVPAYVVFTDATLAVLAEQVPTNDAELARIPGVGVRKLADYGPAVLSVLSGADPAQAAAGEDSTSPR